MDQPALPMDGTYTYNQNGEGVKVFVLDTGVRCRHNEFGGRCTPGWSVENSNSACDPSDFTCAEDNDGHGTHCAGTIAGTTYGVAKGAEIVAVQVLDDTGSGSWAGIIAGMDWVSNQKANQPSIPMVASMSLGGGTSSSIDTAVRNLHNAGVVVSVAAGNDDDDACNYSPARAPVAVTVGSTTKQDARSGFSNYGSCVDIYGPGSSITSAWKSSNTASNTISGTSMACPHVSGKTVHISRSLLSFVVKNLQYCEFILCMLYIRQEHFVI